MGTWDGPPKWEFLCTFRLSPPIHHIIQRFSCLRPRDAARDARRCCTPAAGGDCFRTAPSPRCPYSQPPFYSLISADMRLRCHCKDSAKREDNTRCDRLSSSWSVESDMPKSCRHECRLGRRGGGVGGGLRERGVGIGVESVRVAELSDDLDETANRSYQSVGMRRGHTVWDESPSASRPPSPSELIRGGSLESGFNDLQRTFESNTSAQ